ncbi:MAG: polyprenol monophosphomannose synthase [bacterium]|nr:polyprenol monophosphomannose synthase [bacterium]
MRAIAVVPTYNEAATIVPLIRGVLARGEGIEVLVVDDGSPDGTWRLVADEAERDGRVHLLLRTGRRGRGLAGAEGFRRALDMGADLVIEMDGDLSHDPRHIPALLGAAEAADVVIGSRHVPGGADEERGPLRRLVSRLARGYLRAVLGLAVRDPTSGYRCYRREALEALLEEPLRSEDPFIVTEMLHRARVRGMRIAEVPIVFRARAGGVSKLGPATLARYLARAVALRARRRTDQGTPP